jgi:hypothetical protein
VLEDVLRSLELVIPPSPSPSFLSLSQLRGLGGIGFDVSEFLTHHPYDESASDIHDQPLPAHVDKVSSSSTADTADEPIGCPPPPS